MDFYNKYLSLCKERELAPTTVAKMIGLSKPTVTAWKNGGKCSDITLKKIADFFEVPVSYFYEEEKKPTFDKEDELEELLTELRDREDMRLLFRLAKGATPEDVRQAVRIIEAIRNPYSE